MSSIIVSLPSELKLNFLDCLSSTSSPSSLYSLARTHSSFYSLYHRHNRRYQLEYLDILLDEAVCFARWEPMIKHASLSPEPLVLDWTAMKKVLPQASVSDVMERKDMGLDIRLTSVNPKELGDGELEKAATIHRKATSLVMREFMDLMSPQQRWKNAPNSHKDYFVLFFTRWSYQAYAADRRMKDFLSDIWDRSTSALECSSQKPKNHTPPQEIWDQGCEGILNLDGLLRSQLEIAASQLLQAYLESIAERTGDIYARDDQREPGSNRLLIPKRYGSILNIESTIVRKIWRRGPGMLYDLIYGTELQVLGALREIGQYRKRHFYTHDAWTDGCEESEDDVELFLKVFRKAEIVDVRPGMNFRERKMGRRYRDVLDGVNVT